MGKSFYNYEISENIVCPYWGKIYEPTYEDTYINEQPVDCYCDTIQFFKCDHCNKKFRLECERIWQYTTETIDGEMTEEERENL